MDARDDHRTDELKNDERDDRPLSYLVDPDISYKKKGRPGGK